MPLLCSDGMIGRVRSEGNRPQRYHQCMTENTEQAGALLRAIRVLDGGMASELEFLGASLDGPLWSAQVLEDAPEKIVAVHRAYLEAGAECLLTAGYQVSRMGYAEIGLPPGQADAALLRAVELARTAAAEFPQRRVVVAASLGPYGAALIMAPSITATTTAPSLSWSSFTASASPSSPLPTGRSATPDLLAFETLPSLEEARAIGEALVPWPNLAAWFSFTCKDAQHVAHGEPLSECAAAVAKFPQTVAIGVNCTQPALPACAPSPTSARPLRSPSLSTPTPVKAGTPRPAVGPEPAPPRALAPWRPTGLPSARSWWAAVAAPGPRTSARWPRQPGSAEAQTLLQGPFST